MMECVTSLLRKLGKSKRNQHEALWRDAARRDATLYDGWDVVRRRAEIVKQHRSICLTRKASRSVNEGSQCRYRSVGIDAGAEAPYRRTSSIARVCFRYGLFKQNHQSKCTTALAAEKLIIDGHTRFIYEYRMSITLLENSKREYRHSQTLRCDAGNVDSSGHKAIIGQTSQRGHRREEKNEFGGGSSTVRWVSSVHRLVFPMSACTFYNGPMDL
ncbi:hypothetical protein CBL_13403 [Carabus blaptoides fortunei]